MTLAIQESMTTSEMKKLGLLMSVTTNKIRMSTKTTVKETAVMMARDAEDIFLTEEKVAVAPAVAAAVAETTGNLAPTEDTVGAVAPERIIAVAGARAREVREVAPTVHPRVHRTVAVDDLAGG